MCQSKEMHYDTIITRRNSYSTQSKRLAVMSGSAAELQRPTYPYFRSRTGELRYDGPSTEVARRKAETRRYCASCECVLYVRSSVDHARNEHDLDEIFTTGNGTGVLCFRCHGHEIIVI